MSIETWSTEFYPILANDSSLDTDIKRVEHSLQKWKGLRQENLEKHCINRRIEGFIHINSTTCVLCIKHFDSTKPGKNRHCDTCPLKQHLGEPCDDTQKSPYNIYTDYKDPEPMIAALEATLKSLRN